MKTVFFVFSLFLIMPLVWGDETPQRQDEISSIDVLQDFLKDHTKVNLKWVSPQRGQTQNPITLVEFGDYQGSFEKKWHDVQQVGIDKKYLENNLLKYYFVDNTFLGKDSRLAAQAAHCAGEQNQYWEYNDILLSKQKTQDDGWTDTQSLLQYARELDLVWSDFATCLKSNSFTDAVNQNSNIAKSFNPSGTPTFLLVGPDGTSEIIKGAQPLSEFELSLDLFLVTDIAVNEKFPPWLNNNIKNWVDGDISDQGFKQIIIYISDGEKIDRIIPTNDQTKIPSWIKITANWLVEKKLPEKEFLTAINYLVIHNIIRI